MTKKPKCKNHFEWEPFSPDEHIKETIPYTSPSFDWEPFKPNYLLNQKEVKSFA